MYFWSSGFGALGGVHGGVGREEWIWCVGEQCWGDAVWGWTGLARWGWVMWAGFLEKFFNLPDLILGLLPQTGHQLPPKATSTIFLKTNIFPLKTAQPIPLSPALPYIAPGTHPLPNCTTNSLPITQLHCPYHLPWTSPSSNSSQDQPWPKPEWTNPSHAIKVTTPPSNPYPGGSIKGVAVLQTTRKKLYRRSWSWDSKKDFLKMLMSHLI